MKDGHGVGGTWGERDMEWEIHKWGRNGHGKGWSWGGPGGTWGREGHGGGIVWDLKLKHCTEVWQNTQQ